MTVCDDFNMLLGRSFVSGLCNKTPKDQNYFLPRFLQPCMLPITSCDNDGHDQVLSTSTDDRCLLNPLGV